MVRVIGSIFKGKNKEGDFDFMIRSGNYRNCLFIFNDNEDGEHFTCIKGGGNAIIRQYNKYSRGYIQSVGINTGFRYQNNKGYPQGGYQILDEYVKSSIDYCIEEIKEILRSGNYNTIIYSSDNQGLIGMSIFNIAFEVRQYITFKIKELENIH